MIRLPPPKVRLLHFIPEAQNLHEELSKSSINGTGFFGQLNEKLVQLQSENSPSTVLQSTLSRMSNDYSQECDNFRKSICDIREELNQEGLKDMIKIQSDIFVINVTVMKSVSNWKNHLSKFFEIKRKEDKTLLKTPKVRIASGGNLLEDACSQPQSLPALPTTDKALTEQDLGTLTNPFSPTIHPDLYLKPNILVDETQPSTIIAYAIGSQEHLELLYQHSQSDKKYLDCTFGSDCGSSKFFVRVHFPTEFHHFR